MDEDNNKVSRRAQLFVIDNLRTMPNLRKIFGKYDVVDKSVNICDLYGKWTTFPVKISKLFVQLLGTAPSDRAGFCLSATKSYLTY